jgi:uncharacterized tellurite resistance protein B-like protein
MIHDAQSNRSTHLNALFGRIALKLKAPAGFAALTHDERRFLLALLLAAVVPADRKIKSEEIGALGQLLQSRYGLRGELFTKAMVFARSQFASREEFRLVANRMEDLLSIEDRCRLIGEMWDIALSDNELHEAEERLILEIANDAGIPRKRAVEQQTRANARQQ